MSFYYEDKTCIVCGRVFTPKSGNAKTCSVHCSRKNQAIYRKLTYDYDSELKRSRTVKEQKELIEKKGTMDQLTKDTIEAHKRGMSYGKYVNLYKDKRKNDAEWSVEFNNLKKIMEGSV